MSGKMFGETTLVLSMHTVATNPVCSDRTEVNFSSLSFPIAFGIIEANTDSRVDKGIFWELNWDHKIKF